MNAPRTSRTGSLIRGQGVNIFWGGLSLFFAAAAVFYYWQYVEHEQHARVLRDQEVQILKENDQLRAQVDTLQESAKQTNNLLMTRNERLREQVEVASRLAQEAEQADKARAALAAANKKEIENLNKMRATINEARDIKMAETVYRGAVPVLRIENAALFKPGGLELTPQAPRALKRIAQVVGPMMDHNEVLVEAFTDNDPITGSMLQTYASNFELAAARAGVIARYLIAEGGLPADRVVVVSRGPNYPVMPNTSPELKAQNRRVEILLSPAPRMMRESLKAPAKAAKPDKDAKPDKPVEPEVIDVQAVEPG